MNKPITLIYEETKNEIAEIINDSGLPAFIVESILKDFIEELIIVKKKQYEKDKETYEKSLSEVER